MKKIICLGLVLCFCLPVAALGEERVLYGGDMLYVDRLASEGSLIVINIPLVTNLPMASAVITGLTDKTGAPIPMDLQQQNIDTNFFYTTSNGWYEYILTLPFSMRENAILANSMRIEIDAVEYMLPLGHVSILPYSPTSEQRLLSGSRPLNLPNHRTELYEWQLFTKSDVVLQSVKYSAGLDVPMVYINGVRYDKTEDMGLRLPGDEEILLVVQQQDPPGERRWSTTTLDLVITYTLPGEMAVHELRIGPIWLTFHDYERRCEELTEYLQGK